MVIHIYWKRVSIDLGLVAEQKASLLSTYKAADTLLREGSWVLASAGLFDWVSVSDTFVLKKAQMFVSVGAVDLI